MRFTGPESISACKDDHLCARLKMGVDGAVHGVQDIWYTNSTTEDWGYMGKTCSTRSIESELCGQLDIYGHPYLDFF